MGRTTKKTNQSNNALKGFSIYKDEHGRNVYYDRLTHNGYIVTASDVNQYNLYSNRFIIPVMVFALLYSLNIGGFEFGYLGGAAAALLSLAAMEFIFRFRFLKSLTMIPNFQPSVQDSYMNRIKNSADRHILFLRAVLYILLGILLIIFGFEKQFILFEWIVCGAISCIALLTGLVNLIAGIKK